MTILEKELASPSSAAIPSLVHAVVRDNVGAVVSQAVLSEVVKRLSDGTVKDADVRKRCIEGVLEALSGRVVNYEEQVRRPALD